MLKAEFQLYTPHLVLNMDLYITPHIPLIYISFWYVSPYPTEVCLLSKQYALPTSLSVLCTLAAVKATTSSSSESSESVLVPNGFLALCSRCLNFFSRSNDFPAAMYTCARTEENDTIVYQYISIYYQLLSCSC